jgi:antirestriction protein ArdC
MSEIVTLTVDGKEREYRVLVVNGAPQLIGYGVNLSNADLSGADLQGLDLSFVNLQAANLSFAKLSGCNLSFADLTGAQAAGTDLRGSTLRGAVTLDASLIGADLRGATYDTRTVRGAFISDELTPQYLRTLGISAPVDPASAEDSLSRSEQAAELEEQISLLEAKSAVADGWNEQLAKSDVETNGLPVTRDQDGVLSDAPSARISALPTQPNEPRGGRVRDYSELLEGLSVGIAALTTSERWTQYLDVQSKFYRYSPNNVMLLLLQNENATRVAGYKKWQELGRQVKAKESALRILAPMTYKRDDAPEGEKAREIRGFKLVPVFDISQTEGPDLPDIVSKLEGLAPERVFATLTEFAQGIGFRVERPQSLESGANGDTTHSEGRIRVVSTNSEAQQAKTLAHEIGHALLHDPGVEATKDLERGLKELEAESTAYVICTALGMDTSDYSFGYVAGWAGGAPEATQGIKASTGRIQKAATAVLKTFEVEEPAVEATNDVSIEIAAERSVDVDTTLVVGERRTEDLVDLDCSQEIADASDGHIQVLSVDLSLRDAPASAYQPLSAAQLDVLDCPADMWRDLGV